MQQNFILTNEEICEVVKTHMEIIEPNDVLGMVEEAIEEIKGSGNEALEAATPIEKLVLISTVIYRKGFFTGVYMLNEAAKGEQKGATENE